jgi:hypothetical protein
MVESERCGGWHPGGWEVSGVWTVQSGLPFTVLSGQDFSNTGSTSPRPDRTCSGLGHKTVSDWFDATCFNTNSLAQAKIWRNRCSLFS